MIAKEFELCIDASRKDEPSLLCPRVKIAVLDTGADLTHLDMVDAIAKKLIKHYDFVENTPNMVDLGGHGTHCASQVLKLAPNAEVYIGRVFRSNQAESSSPAILAKVSLVILLYTS
jgi:subtilisin family serine protease